MKQQTRRSISTSRKSRTVLIGALAALLLLAALAGPPLVARLFGDDIKTQPHQAQIAPYAQSTLLAAQGGSRTILARMTDSLMLRQVSFLAVGDNLVDDNISAWADSLAGGIGDGEYDFTPIYAPIAPYVQAADLAYMKNEVHLWNVIDPHGYPSYCAPEAVAPAVVATGFDLIGSASNHSFDWGFDACANNAEVWNRQPVAFFGSAASQEQANTLVMVEKNGISFALLDYTYGINGYDSIEPAWAINIIDEERIRADVTAARQRADVVVVAMHWGIENQTEPSDYQLQYAQLLADLDVDLVLGSHPHCIGELHWLTGASGHQTLVAYSLGNFISQHPIPGAKNELEGMLTCNIMRRGDDVWIQDVVWTPLVNQTGNDGSCAVYALKDYTPELASSHVLFSQMDDPLGWLRATTDEVIGPEWTIDY